MRKVHAHMRKVHVHIREVSACWLHRSAPHDPPPDRHVLATRQTLDLQYCRALTSLPAELANLTSLQTLKLHGSDALTSMPDLSGLPQLQA